MALDSALNVPAHLLATSDCLALSVCPVAAALVAHTPDCIRSALPTRSRSHLFLSCCCVDSDPLLWLLPPAALASSTSSLPPTGCCQLRQVSIISSTFLFEATIPISSTFLMRQFGLFTSEMKLNKLTPFSPTN